ncbi:hypothetical protein CDIK_0749 [Cucumispora dikerogammari]|nr:hypothetical protein CDIK_0749 [Cucumispora dikerogammari]
MTLETTSHKQQIISLLLQLNKSLKTQIYKDDKIDTLLQMWNLMRYPEDITFLGIYCQENLTANINIDEAREILLKLFSSSEGREFLEIFLKKSENIQKVLHLMLNGHKYCTKLVDLIIEINSNLISLAFLNEPSLFQDLRKNVAFILKIEDDNFKKQLVLNSYFEILMKNFKDNCKIICHILKGNVFTQNYFLELKWIKKLEELNQRDLLYFLDSLFDKNNINFKKLQSLIKTDWIHTALKYKKYSLLLKFIRDNPTALKVVFENLILIEYTNEIDFVTFLEYLMQFRCKIEREPFTEKFIEFEENIFLHQIISKSLKSLEVITLELITLLIYLQADNKTSYDFLTFFKDTVLFMLYSIKQQNKNFVLKYFQLIIFFEFEFSDEEKMFLREMNEFCENETIKGVVSVYLKDSLDGYLKMLYLNYTLRNVDIFVKNYLLTKVEVFVQKEYNEIQKLAENLKSVSNDKHKVTIKGKEMPILKVKEAATAEVKDAASVSIKEAHGIVGKGTSAIAVKDKTYFKDKGAVSNTESETFEGFDL